MADLSGLSDEDKQQALDIGASTPLEGTTIDAGDKAPDMTPTIGDDPPEYGKTFVATSEPEPEPLQEPPIAPTPEAPPVPDSLSGMSEEDLQAARDIGAATPLDGASVDSADKSPDMTPAIGDDLPEYGKTFDTTPEPVAEMPAEAAPEVPTDAPLEAPPEPLPEAVPEVTADAPMDAQPEITPESIPDIAPEAQIDPAPEVTPDVALEITPEVVPEVTAEVAPETAPEMTEASSTNPDTVPDASVEEEDRQRAIEAAAESQINEHLSASYGDGSSSMDYSSPTPEASPDPIPEPTPGPEMS